MTDLSVLLPDSTDRKDVDGFCSSLSAAISRRRQSAGQASSPACRSVEIAGVADSLRGQSRFRTDDAIRNSEARREARTASGGIPALAAALESAAGQFVVWVPHPEAPEAARQVADLLARRRELPILSGRRSDGKLLAINAGQTFPSGTESQTGLITLVNDLPDSCLVLRNSVPAGFSGTQTAASDTSANHSSGWRVSPWINSDERSHRRPEAAPVNHPEPPAAQHECQQQRKQKRGQQEQLGQPDISLRKPLRPTPAAQPRIRVRLIALATVVAAAGWLVRSGDSSMSAATDPVAERPATEFSTTDRSARSESARLAGSVHLAGSGDPASGDPASGDPGAPAAGPASQPDRDTSDSNRDSDRSGDGSLRLRRPVLTLADGGPRTPDRVQSQPRSRTDKQSENIRNGILDLAPQAVERRILRDATFLASDELEGRGVRTQGLDRAAEYLAREFASAGLNTAHYQGTPFQEFELLSIGGESPVQHIEFRGPKGAVRQLVPDRDFSSLLLSRRATLNVPVVFAGFGISAPEVGYDDYSGIDVADRAVLILRHAPPAFQNTAGDLAEHSYVRTKIAAASSRGAAVVLLCSDRTSLDAADADARTDPLLRVELVLDEGIRPVPVIHCRRDLLTDLLNGFSGFDLDTVERAITETGRPASQLLDGLRLAARVSQLRRGRTLKNVLATLESPQATSEETIILGAHYDHLGRGGWGSLTLGANDAIHNGADDNASGTAVLLEVARQLAARNTPPARRILFIAFSAEELGLIGSRRYIKEPLVPIRQSIAMLNLDMVGRLRNNRLTVYGTGSSKTWPALLETFAPRRELTIVSKRSGYGPSDHASFYEAGVPVLHFFTGFHPQYHRPEDDIEHLNVAGMRRITGLIVDLITALAESPDRPARSLVQEDSLPGSLPSELIRLVPPGLRPSRPLLGIVPGRRQDGQTGVLVRQTIADSLADQYGIRTGDVIVRVGENRIDSVEQLVSRVQAQKNGARLPIELVRNGIRMQLLVRF